MTFGALAAWQAWLLVGLAAAAAIAVFRLKVRPPRVVVPTLLMWRRVLDLRADRSWIERIRRAVSLVIAAAIACALAWAVGRPAPATAAGPGARVLIVLDTSWSMRAETPGGGSRWQRALDEVRTIAARAGGDDLVLATTGDGLVEGPTSDPALIATALAHLQPTGAGEGPWPRVDGARVVHFVTDGATSRTLDPAVVVHSVFEPAPNVAVTAFVARPATSSAAAPEAYLEVSNYAASSQQVRIVVTRDARPVLERSVEMGAGQALRQVLRLETDGGPRLGVHVSAPLDALDVDDDAVAWLTTADPVRVTLVSETPGVLASLLEHDPNVRVNVVDPSGYAASDADVVLFDRWLPADAPRQPALLIAPPAAGWFGHPGAEEAGPEWAESRAHPVLAGVDPFTLVIRHARAYESAGLTPVAVSARGTPLVSVLDSPAARRVVMGFAVGESNLAAAPAFPVLIGNALEWLAHPASGEPRTPGPMELSASTTRVLAPDGRSVPLVRAGDRVLADLREPGLYAIEAGGSRRVVGVNVGRPDIANLMRTTVEPSNRRPGGVGGRPWWMYGVMAAFLLMAAEWLTWQRRVTV